MGLILQSLLRPCIPAANYRRSAPVTLREGPVCSTQASLLSRRHGRIALAKVLKVLDRWNVLWPARTASRPNLRAHTGPVVALSSGCGYRCKHIQRQFGGSTPAHTRIEKQLPRGTQITTRNHHFIISRRSSLVRCLFGSWVGGGRAWLKQLQITPISISTLRSSCHSNVALCPLNTTRPHKAAQDQLPPGCGVVFWVWVQDASTFRDKVGGSTPPWSVVFLGPWVVGGCRCARLSQKLGTGILHRQWSFSLKPLHCAKPFAFPMLVSMGMGHPRTAHCLRSFPGALKWLRTYNAAESRGSLSTLPNI